MSTAPIAAPTIVPRPPIATHNTISIDGTIPIMEGDIMPTWSTNSMPARPASAPEIAKAVI
ncbi:hypothetical protein D3C84_1114380 [compost metagenome]